MNSGDSQKCPVCGKTVSSEYHPFCSMRCAEVDLGRWLTGSYYIPRRMDENEDD